MMTNSSYCLEANVRNPEHLAFLAAQCLGDEKLIKDAAFRYLLRNIPQLDDEIKYVSFLNKSILTFLFITKVVSDP